MNTSTETTGRAWGATRVGRDRWRNLIQFYGYLDPKKMLEADGRSVPAPGPSLNPEQFEYMNSHPVLIVLAIAVAAPLLAEIPVGVRLPVVLLELHPLQMT